MDGHSKLFVTGGTGFIGQRLIKAALERGHPVTAVARAGSEGKLPAGCKAVVANPLVASSYAHAIEPGAIFVQLVGRCGRKWRRPSGKRI